MNSCELVTMISAVACAINNCCSEEEMSLLSAVFTQLSDTLKTIQEQNELCEKYNQTSKTNYYEKYSQTAKSNHEKPSISNNE